MFHSCARSKFRNWAQHFTCTASYICTNLNSAFSGIGKRSMLNILKSDEKMADAILDSLGVYPDEVDEEAMRACIKFVSNLYMGKGTYQSTTKMRKYLFSKKQLVSDSFPSTEPELAEHIKRANYQSYIWQNATKLLFGLPSPEGNGWSRSEDGDLVPTKNVNPPAPEGFIELTTCKCQTGCKNKEMTFSVVMLAFAEKDVKTEALLRQTVMRMRI